MDILSTGCQLRALPKDLPPRSTVHDYGRPVELGRHAGSHPSCALPQVPRESRARSQPHGRIIDSQSVKSAEKGGLASTATRFDAGKLIKGKKRVLVDTQGLLLARHRSPPPTFRIATAVSRCRGDLVRSVSLSREIVRRQRLSGLARSFTAPWPASCPISTGRSFKRSDRVKRRLRRPAQALGGRTHHRLAQPLPPTGQGLGEPQPQRARLHQARVHSTHAPKTL